MIYAYLERIRARFETGIATEHTFRGDLQQLLEAFDPAVIVTNEPTRIACGAPDFILTKRGVPLGYVEAKDIGVSLKKAEATEQLTRYKASLDNLILTDYLDFWLYRHGAFVTSAAIAEIKQKKIIPLPERFRDFEDLIREFYAHVGQTIVSAAQLAEMMAGKARMLQTVIAQAVTGDGEPAQNSSLQGQMDAFKKMLIHDLTPPEFADMYAQTIAYGMFAARAQDAAASDFSRQKAAELIPKSNPLLRNLFGYIAGPNIDDRIIWIVDALADIFRAADLAAIMRNFGSSTQTSDPVIHFYETFLAQYNPQVRKSRGVWYTPEPVVNFIARAVDDLLKTEFGLPQGLADKSSIRVTTHEPGSDNAMTREFHKVQILDPAAGTGTFLAEIVKQIYQKFAGQEGSWSDYAENDLIPRLNGFEILMASYAMAHLKLDLLLKETGYAPKHERRFCVYLTNSLEKHLPDMETLFTTWLSNEANEANRVKRDAPVMVIVGNPPYSGESMNKGDWIKGLMDDYKKEPGGKIKLQEKNPKWLNDDYVKFLRYGQYFIEKNGEGILAFINPHGFLDNPTFRGMRWNLLKTYDKIYIIDLHGNGKKKEVCPDGSKDENVFDIMQGVSINVFVKTGQKKPHELGNVFHYDLYGKRDMKYAFLLEHSLQSIPYKELEHVAPDYFFVQKNFDLRHVYNEGFSVNELFMTNSVGIITARDAFIVHESRQKAQETITEFLSLDDETARQRFNLGEDVRDWSIAWARKDLINSGPDFNNIVTIYSRPFDKRFTYYTGKSKGFHCRPHTEVMRHVIKHPNYALIFTRYTSKDKPFNHIFITRDMIIARFYTDASCVPYLAPLYRYPESTGQINIGQSAKRTPNLNSEIVKQIAEKLGLAFTHEKEDAKDAFAPIDLLDYIYAVLHSPTYRETYKEFLKIDFPRVPYPNNRETFWQLAALGGELRRVHLLESPRVERFVTQYPISGSNVVEKVAYHNGSAQINETQYFANVPETAWEFSIGGYQPAQKWLKDRKGRALRFDDIQQYQKIIAALLATEQLMQQIEQIDVM